jgi:hypothetical protein
MNKVAALVVLLVAVALIRAWLYSRKMMPARSSRGVDPERVGRFFERPMSFSLVVFEGDYLAELDAFLGECKYQILERISVTGLPGEICAGLPDQTGPNNEIVFKAAYAAGGYTVLFDPEMVLAAANKDELFRFCSDHRSRAVCAIWERVSETVAFIEFSETGLVRNAWYVVGKQMEAPLGPPASLIKSPDAAGLLYALWQWGVPKSILTDPATATQYKLKA